jgi:hypothetical protein
LASILQESIIFSPPTGKKQSTIVSCELFIKLPVNVILEGNLEALFSSGSLVEELQENISATKATNTTELIIFFILVFI